jgi:hypothetical protein
MADLVRIGEIDRPERIEQHGAQSRSDMPIFSGPY